MPVMSRTQHILKSLLQVSFLHNIWSLLKGIATSWRFYHVEKPDPFEELADTRETAASPSFAFFFLMISASVIATLGLLLDSSAVIIGAMIVAPLMNPILSMSFAIVRLDWAMYGRSLATIFLGGSCAVSISFCIGFLMPINVVGSEVIVRTSPNLLDLGVAIAAGAAGSFSLTRRSIANSIAGVAIAVALVPPLCVVGIGLGIGERLAADVSLIAIDAFGVAEGAFMLFLANLAGISFTACIVFISQSYGSLKKSFRALVLWALILIVLALPLSTSLKEFLVANRVRLEIQEISEQASEHGRSVQIRHIGVILKDDTADVTVLMNAPEGALSIQALEESEKQIFDAVSEWGIKEMNFIMRIIPVQIQEYQSFSKHDHEE